VEIYTSNLEFWSIAFDSFKQVLYLGDSKLL